MYIYTNNRPYHPVEGLYRQDYSTSKCIVYNITHYLHNREHDRLFLVAMADLAKSSE